MSARITTNIAITGQGVWNPGNILSNAELCVAFNEFVIRDNAANAEAIAAGTMTALRESTPEFIEKASGIKQRYVHDKTGLMDSMRLCPNVPDRREDELSVQAEYAVNAAHKALAAAGRVGEEIDLVVLGASSLQRMYPAIAIEVQAALGARGYAFDMSLGCSAATGALIQATQALQAGTATCALVVVPEMTTGHMNWRERDSHFIFGDASVAMVLEPLSRAKQGGFEILSTKMISKFSSNIRNNQGFLNRCDPQHAGDVDKLFHQQGRRVFKDVVPMASKFILDHLSAHDLAPSAVARYWLHQANQNMNELIVERVLGRVATRTEAPLILDEYGNTASAGSLIAFSNHHADLASGAFGIMSSFGAGYSLGSLMLQRL
jgi:beta-ketodecanoyl-[acyl-carrier-protein] synthase